MEVSRQRMVVRRLFLQSDERTDVGVVVSGVKGGERTMRERRAKEYEYLMGSPHTPSSLQ